MVSHQPYHVDPEVDGILREIAADPRSSLFRPALPRNPMSWAEYSDPLSPRTPDLTSAEKHLITVHRVEVAHLLRDRWLIEIQRNPYGHLHIVVADGTGGHTQHLQTDSWDRQVNRQDLYFPGESATSEILGLLPSRRPLEDRAISSLVATAMRLDPSSTSRIYLAQDFVRLRQYHSATALLAKVVCSDPAQPMVCSALEGLGQIKGLEKKFEAARDIYRQSVQAHAARVSSLGGWFMFCCQTGDLNGGREAGDLIDSLDVWADSAFELFTQESLRTRNSGEWSPTSAAGPTSKSLMEVLAKRSRRILDALQ